jgi:ribosomal-protein-alanine N-acetyltransferase
MVFLRSASAVDFGPVLKTGMLTLRLPQMGDYVAWSSLRQISRDRLTPYEPEWAGNELTREAFRNRIRFYHREYRDNSGYPFFIFANNGETLIGGVTLSNVRRGVTQSASLGYWVGLPYQRKGYMSEAVQATTGYGFNELTLHRIEAASLPDNIASIKVLEKCGFQREGLARRFLRINGRWQDHLLFSLLEDDTR